MAVRNFWVEANIDGRKTELAGGPRSSDGEMTIVMYQRQDGQIKQAVEIKCRVTNAGETLVSRIIDENGRTLHRFETNRNQKK